MNFVLVKLKGPGFSGTFFYFVLIVTFDIHA
jgi:hypothetical protein